MSLLVTFPWLGSVSTRFKKQVESTANSAFLLWKQVLFTLRTTFSPPSTRMYCLLYRKATWFISYHAAETVNMYAMPSKGSRTELNNTFPNLSGLFLLPRNAYFLPVDSNLPPTPIICLLLHLLQNSVCAQHYDDSGLSILAQGRSPYHLPNLEATSLKLPTPTKRIHVHCTA